MHTTEAERDDERAWRPVRVDPEWAEFGFGAFDCACGEGLGGIIGAGETRECERCGRVYRLRVIVEVAAPGVTASTDTED